MLFDVAEVKPPVEQRASFVQFVPSPKRTETEPVVVALQYQPESVKACAEFLRRSVAVAVLKLPPVASFVVEAMLNDGVVVAMRVLASMVVPFIAVLKSDVDVEFVVVPFVAR